MQLPFKLCLCCQIYHLMGADCRRRRGVCTRRSPYFGKEGRAAAPFRTHLFGPPDPGALWEKPQREWVCGHGQGSCRAAS